MSLKRKEKNMNKKNQMFLFEKLNELKANNIISNEDCLNAKEFYGETKENSPRSMVTIITAIGVLLLGLSIITLFAFNWDNLSVGIKSLVAFIPLMITAIMLYITLNKDDKRWEIYTSIFGALAIISTNALISQIFHIQTTAQDLIFLSLIMFVPILAIFRNTIGIIIYGIEAIICSLSGPFESSALIPFLVIIPVLLYNIYCYVKNKESGQNIIMGLINIILITLFIFSNEILRAEILPLYLYLVYLISMKIFGKKNAISEIFSIGFMAYLMLFTIDKSISASFYKDTKIILDTAVMSVLVLGLGYNLKLYKNVKEIIMFLFILIANYLIMPDELVFLIINLLALAIGINYIYEGNKLKLFNKSIKGVGVILLVITFRFINSDFTFMQKSIMFLITGASFIAIANYMKKKIGGE